MAGGQRRDRKRHRWRLRRHRRRLVAAARIEHAGRARCPRPSARSRRDKAADGGDRRTARGIGSGARQDNQARIFFQVLDEEIYSMDMRTMKATIYAEKLAMRHVDKLWGKAHLPKPFDNLSADKIGEIWFEAKDGPALPLMVKYLFTSEKLSIQVHPSDAEAQAIGLASGKEECWLVLDADTDATLGIGTLRELSPDELRAAALDGSIEGLIDWKPVQRGDFFYIPAGTVHAIGAGVSLIEIQQNADITYRLYDYGRPRELHLDDGVAVSKAAPYYHPLQRKVDFAVDQTLVDGPLFAVRLTGNSKESLPGKGPLIVAPIEGHVTAVTGDALINVVAGECRAIDPEFPFEASSGARLLLARAI